jgi:hypothetical protein
LGLKHVGVKFEHTGVRYSVKKVMIA